MLSMNPEVAKAHALIAEYTRQHTEQSLPSIAKRFGISMPWLHKILRAHNVHRKVRSALADRLQSNPDLFEVDGVK